MIKLEHNVNDIQQNLNIFLQNRLTNLSNLKDQQVACKERVKEIRLKINHHLDKLEKLVIDEIDTTYKKHKTEVEQVVDGLNERKIKIGTIQNNIGKIKDHASEIQIFLSIQDIQQNLKEEENQMVKIGQNELREIELSFLPASSCTSGIILESLGDLKTNIKPADKSFIRQEDSEAQLILPGAKKKMIFM
ncbi:unnamed protein product [Mytilus coruscus]|uniref:Uncharacterized protein n=1 Tax=Mytilus coruscus TaxID=42192 RepID=A0A6J8CTP7_MYTCO|nr:unnamed protein product [Mytilus coruscus]